MRIRMPSITINKKTQIIILTATFVLGVILSAHAYPVAFTDSSGEKVIISQRPKRIVSLVPSMTEIIFRLGAGDAVKGLTHHSNHPPEVSQKQIIGGFFQPSIQQIRKLQPDVIFYSPLQQMVKANFKAGSCQLIHLDTDSIAQSFVTIRLLGRIFNQSDAALSLVSQIGTQLKLVKKKVARIPAPQKKRVVRLMSRVPLMAPGDDSFQNEMIRAAGGIPPRWSKNGRTVPVSEAELINFNPQAIYGCGGDREAALNFFNRPGLKDMDAVKHHQIYFFPCDLTCRAATNTGHFVSWLSAKIYAQQFTDPQNRVLTDHIVEDRDLSIDLSYIKKASITVSRIFDFPNKTLIIDFNTPLSMVSTLEGYREGIEAIGNHYFSPPCWSISHQLGFQQFRQRVYTVIGKSPKTASFLFTGADMDHLAARRETYKDMIVYALVTAGVRSNAIRTSQDMGNYYEPGTINIILLTNRKLSHRAMTRAIITATEAKTAALADTDIRSSYSPHNNRATGTGTDNILIVQGIGSPINLTGGHAKMGELIARAVYGAVQEAVYNQNGITAQRHIFERLKDRRISLYSLVSDAKCDCDIAPNELVAAMEEILLDPRYAAFVATAFAVSDDVERGLIRDLGLFDALCHQVASEIAGRELTVLEELIGDEFPQITRMALNAIFNGVRHMLR